MQLKDFDFRLWHKPSERFVEIKSAFITTNGKDEIVFDRAYNVPIDDESVEIELWSGFHDSKGKKIYENDIVCCYFAMNGLVIFENAMFYVLNQHSGEKKPLFEALQESQAEKEPFVVESNIHEECKALEKDKRMIKTQAFYINKKNKQTYYVYNIATYKSGDTDFTCVIYAPCYVGNNKSREYYVRSIDDFKAKFYKKHKIKTDDTSFL